MSKTDFAAYQWMNEGNIRFEGDSIIIEATANSDFFCNNGAVAEEGLTPESLTNAPFFYTEVTGISCCG